MLTLENLCKDFLAFQLNNGIRKETERYNNDQIVAILKFFDFQGIKTISDITINLVGQFISYTKEHTNALQTSLIKRFNMLKRVIKFGLEMEYFESNKAINYLINYRFKKVESVHKPPLNEDELTSLLKYLESLNIKHFNNIRTKAMIYVCLATGVRITELTRLKAKNVDFKNDTIYFEETKTGDPRKGYFSKVVKDILKYYFQYYIKSPDQPLFYSSKDMSTPLTVDNIDCLFKRISEKLGFRVTIHIIRHTFACQTLKNGIDIESLRRLMGHKSLSTTQIYLNFDDSYTKENSIKYGII